MQSAEGDWVPVDVTPQHTDPIDSEARRQRDPENVTEVRPETAEEVVAPEPVQRDTVTDDPPQDRRWTCRRSGRRCGCSASSRSSSPSRWGRSSSSSSQRRCAAAVGGAARMRPSRVVGGWDEYVDSAVDHGLPAPAAETRTELAARYATPAGVALADTADRTVFSPVGADGR